jgi:ABC-type transport system involved in multi-copper enzyme maturation permease subunit
MIRLVGAELLKLRTTWGIWVYLVLLVAVVALAVAGTIGTHEGPFSSEDLRGIYQTPVLAFLFPLLIGAVGFTNEFRHGTIGQTLLVTPRRGRVVGAKLATFALVGLALAVLGIAVTVGMAAAWLDAKGAATGLSGPEFYESAFSLLVGFAILGAFGAGIGGAVRNQAAAAIAILLWFLLLEVLVGVLLGVIHLDRAARYLPASAAAAIVGESGDADDLLPQTAGILVSLGWTAVAGAAAAISLRRDVT